MRVLTGQQVWSLADAAGEGQLAVLVLAWCGLRFGELSALRMGRYDHGRREIRVEVSATEIGGHLVEGTPKTVGSVRRVPVPEWLADELAPLLVDRGPDDYLLTAPEGGPLRLGNWHGRVFDPAVRSAGLARQVTGDMVRPHDMRHTCASLHIRQGTPPKVLSEMLGHASVSITLDRYGHLYPGDAHHYVDRLAEVALQDHADWMRTREESKIIALPLTKAVNGP